MSISLIPVPNFLIVQPGDNIADLIGEALAKNKQSLSDGDILVVAQKIVSKAEGALIKLSTVTPSERANVLAKETNKDPRLVELILSESSEVVRHRKDVLIVAHHLGLVHANAGIDQSNIEEEDAALLLPKDPDTSAKNIRAELESTHKISLGVIINDSTGRAWRKGTVGIAIGASGVATLEDLRGQKDLTGRKLEITEVGTADQIAAAASLVQGQADEALPVVIVRGLDRPSSDATASDLLRPKDEDLFR
jgi:coenzyme F420-0:L-glutamate ligase/coenzyme F420-1:gamma-L-glutamate ligase